MIHKYSLQDTRRCHRLNAFLGKENNFLFVGDSRLQNLYAAFVNHFQQPKSSDNESTNNLEFFDYKLRLRVNYVSAYDLKSILMQLERLQQETDPPNFIITSPKFINLIPLDRSENYTIELERNFIKNLTLLVKPIDNLVRKQSQVLFKLQDPIDENAKEPSPAWKDVTNSAVEHFNRIVSETMKYSTRIQIWKSSTQIAYGLIDEMLDGYKLGPIALKHDIQILLNMYCNDNMNYNDGTCCSTSENYTMLQIITYAIFLVCSALMIGLLARKWYSRFRGQTLYMPLQQNDGPVIATNGLGSALLTLGILGIIMMYFFLCDRTNFFMKENKYYSEFSFWIPVCWMSAVGFFFTEDSKFTRVMHRDQTDEIKGFMIIVILIYYMTGATRVIPIYMIIKVFISTFLFLIGYQHFTYFWQTGNNGLVRFLNVMFRINFMTIVLCFAMNRPYQFYFFAPLVSFWYAVCYITISLPPRITAQTIENNSYQYLYLVIKFVCLLSVITILYMSEVFFERIFLTRPWRALFVSMDDFVDEWWYRFKLDRYSTASGMFFAAIFIAAQKFNIVDDSNHGNLFSRRISLSSTLLASTGLAFYTAFTFLCKNKQDCEEIHSVRKYLNNRNILTITFLTFYFSIVCRFHTDCQLYNHSEHIWHTSNKILNIVCMVRQNISRALYLYASHMAGCRQAWRFSAVTRISNAQYYYHILYFRLHLT